MYTFSAEVYILCFFHSFHRSAYDFQHSITCGVRAEKPNIFTPLRALKSFRNSAVAFDPFDGILNFADWKKHEKWNFTPSCGYWIFRILNECVLICGNSLRKVKFVWAVHAILPYHTIHVIFELNEAFERGRRRTRKRRKTKSRVIKRVFYWWNVNDVERVDVVGSRKVYVLVKMKSNPILLCMYTAKCFFYVLLRFVCVFVDFHTVAKHFNYYSYFMYEYGM